MTARGWNWEILLVSVAGVLIAGLVALALAWVFHWGPFWHPPPLYISEWV